MKLHDIEIDDLKLAEFCKRNFIRELIFFGSIVRRTFRPDSDIDVLVRFQPGKVEGLWEFAGVEGDLSDLLGREVHLHTDVMLPPKHRDYFLRGALRGFAA